MKSAATNDRNFRTFLLVAQLEAKAIGARLAQARNEAGLTQAQVALMSTVSVRSLQNYESGATIPYRHFEELGGIYRREVTWLLHGDPEPPAPERSGLLGEVSASVADLTEGMHDAIERLSRIEALLESRATAEREESPANH